MKKLFTLIMAGLLTAAMIAPASAAGANEILKGTPVVDGVLDDIYLQSAVTVEPDESLDPYIWNYEGEIFHNGRTYLLWDDDYLYLCTVMEDTTPFSAGEGAGWQNDCSEHWFVDEGLTYKWHIAADGNFFLGTDADGKTPYDSEAALHAAQWTDDTNFCTEIALPLNDLAAGREFTHRMQYNNIVGSDVDSGYAVNTGDADYVCSATEVILPEVEAPVTQAPQTFDTAVIATITAIVSVAGYALSKKR